MSTSALDHHLALYNRLADRSTESSAYRSLLEDVLGFSLEHAVISTSEHAAPFNFASSVSFAVPQLALQGAGLRAPARVLILAATLVPFDNRHYPRGFLMEDGTRFNLFAKRVTKSCPMLQPAVDVSLREDGIPFFTRYPWLRPYLTGIEPFPDAAHQMSAIMEAMAARWFPSGPGCVSIQPFEEVARRMLLRLLESNDPWLGRMLFDTATRRSVAESLMGTFCAWGTHHGSFLFWSCRGDRLGRFTEEDQCLAGDGVKIPITRESLLNALNTRAIVPGIFLSLMATSFLPGLAVAGGPKQPDYYRAMIRAANTVNGLSRSEELSTYGYWCVDMTRLTPNRTCSKTIPPEGAGLWLTGGDCDAEWLCEQLASCPVIPIPAAPQYD